MHPIGFESSKERRIAPRCVGPGAAGLADRRSWADHESVTSPPNAPLPAGGQSPAIAVPNPAILIGAVGVAVGGPAIGLIAGEPALARETQDADADDEWTRAWASLHPELPPASSTLRGAAPGQFPWNHARRAAAFVAWERSRSSSPRDGDSWRARLSDAFEREGTILGARFEAALYLEARLGAFSVFDGVRGRPMSRAFPRGGRRVSLISTRCPSGDLGVTVGPLLERAREALRALGSRDDPPSVTGFGLEHLRRRRADLREEDAALLEHVFTDTKRVRQAEAALAAADLRTVGRLVTASGESFCSNVLPPNAALRRAFDELRSLGGVLGVTFAEDWSLPRFWALAECDMGPAIRTALERRGPDSDVRLLDPNSRTRHGH